MQPSPRNRRTEKDGEKIKINWAKDEIIWSVFTHVMRVLTAAAVNNPTFLAAMSDEDSMRKNAAPKQKKNSIFVHGILWNT